MIELLLALLTIFIVGTLIDGSNVVWRETTTSNVRDGHNTITKSVGLWVL